MINCNRMWRHFCTSTVSRKPISLWWHVFRVAELFSPNLIDIVSQPRFPAIAAGFLVIPAQNGAEPRVQTYLNGLQ